MRMSRTRNKIPYPYDFLTILGYLVEIVRDRTYHEHRQQGKRVLSFDSVWISRDPLAIRRKLCTIR